MKDLGKMYKGSVISSNNKSTFYSNSASNSELKPMSKTNINDEINKILRTLVMGYTKEVEITTSSKKIKTRLIGRNTLYLFPLQGEPIKIEDIISIK